MSAGDQDRTVTPGGFVGITKRLGLKDDADDFMLLAAEGPTTSAAMFTRSRFAGPSVELSRRGRLDGLRGVVVVSKNANVATGAQGLANAEELQARAAALVGCEPEEILVASTGVIGVQYPMDVIRAGLDGLPSPLPEADFEAASRAIMTTDTVPKLQSRRVGDAVVLGMAKGVGMIEPNMATMLTFFWTNAAIPAAELDALFRRVVATTFNAVSIDSDTSTSDTAAIVANGQAGPVDLGDFEAALHECALDLVKSIARDGEGASKLIEVQVTGARDDVQAKRVAKAIVNSPLVKTAVHGADPNWGRVTMAIGKCDEDTDIEQENVTVAFGGMEVYPRHADAGTLTRLGTYLAGDTCVISADLGISDGRFTAYGCDLTEGYIRINADYTT